MAVGRHGIFGAFQSVDDAGVRRPIHVWSPQVPCKPDQLQTPGPPGPVDTNSIQAPASFVTLRRRICQARVPSAELEFDYTLLGQGSFAV